ncbi:MAG: pectate lyase, partial [Verrucomicrobiota bacterium]
AVGMAMLEAYEKTGEKICLEGAVDAARALVKGQLKTGGWNYRIEFNPDDRVRWVYRTDRKHSRRARNTSVLDDDNTQSALQLLMRVDKALNFKDESIHEATLFGLKAVLGAQCLSGAWPQVFDGRNEPEKYKTADATFPDTWPRAYQGHQNYWYRPTLNDNLLADVIDVLFEAGAIYRDPVYRQAALRGGTFILRAQLPDPQPGWAQQYNERMEPIWARKFEPAAITGGESKGVILTLLDLYQRTGEARWLKPIPRALAYYRKSRLPDGRLARFYEMKTNRPLYFTRDYKLTHDDADMPTHYAFKISDWTGSVQKKFDAVKSGKQASRAKPPSPATVRTIVKALDARGAWVESARLKSHRGYEGKIIDCATFNRNIKILADFVAAH